MVRWTSAEIRSSRSEERPTVSGGAPGSQSAAAESWANAGARPIATRQRTAAESSAAAKSREFIGCDIRSSNKEESITRRAGSSAWANLTTEPVAFRRRMRASGPRRLHTRLEARSNMRTKQTVFRILGLVALSAAALFAESWKLPAGTAVKDNGPRA